MSTVVVVRKGNNLAIATDSLVTFGETRLPDGYEANTKLFTLADSIIGTVGTIAHLPVLKQALGALAPEDLQLHTRDGIFNTFVKLHPTLKDRYFLNTKEQDSDPYESSQFSILIVNSSGFDVVWDLCSDGLFRLAQSLVHGVSGT